jgi:hypothetical protein
VLVQAGIGFALAGTWEGDRQLERRRKEPPQLAGAALPAVPGPEEHEWLTAGGGCSRATRSTCAPVCAPLWRPLEVDRIPGDAAVHAAERWRVAPARAHVSISEAERLLAAGGVTGQTWPG